MAVGPPAHAAAPSSQRIDECRWDRPGHDPFMGDLVAAVDRYQDIPAPVRKRLQQRMAARQYDDVVEIRRDSIKGTRAYDAAIRDMHFGEQRVCGRVTRRAWSDRHMERGLVYCDSGNCILVPTVCRNVSRISPAAAGAPTAAAAAAPPQQELVFDPPAAGPPPVLAAAHVPPPTEETFEGLAGRGATSGGVLPPIVDGGSAAAGPGLVTGSQGAAPEAPIWLDLGPTPSFGSPIGRTPLPGIATPVPAVPEPGSWALLLIGLPALLAVAARRRRGAATIAR